MTPIAGLPPPPPDESWQAPAPPTDPHQPEIELAGWGARVGAAAIDLLVRLGILLAFIVLARTLALAGQAAGIGGSDSISLGLIFAAVITAYVVGVAYAPLMMMRCNGQTVGRRVVGTRVVMAGGAPIGGGRIFVREVLVKWLLLEFLGGMFFYVVTLVNYLWPLWDPKNEALHDKICSTRVVKARD